MTVRYCQLLATLLLFVVGCSSGSQPTTETEKNNSNPQTEKSVPAIKTTVATIAEVDEMIAQQNGKVVVLDLWALW